MSYDARRSELSPIVRSYADRLYVRIQNIYKKYGVSSVVELRVKIASGDMPRSLKPGELKSDAEELSKLQDGLELALENNAIPEGEPERSFVILRDVPTFSNGLPSAEVLKDKANGYKFDWVQEDEYREGRLASDFALAEGDLVTIGLDDPRTRQELLREMAEAKENKEQESLAKVFDISETIAEKKNKDPDHPDWLTTKEVLEAMDQAGFRPATIEELLAFGKEQWKPEADSDKLTDEEMKLQLVNAPFVFALGSPFSSSGRSRSRGVPCLRWLGVERSLDGHGLGEGWVGNFRFLVVRKPSS